MKCAALSALLIVTVLAGCKREAREFDSAPSADNLAQIRYQVSVESHGGRQVARVTNWYEQNAYELSRGQQLFEQFNCVGCHAHGGGGIGPALTDATWIYGSDPGEVYSSIMYGRPHGMPAFDDRLRENDAWELAAYVRSLAGLTPKAAAPGRNDEMSALRPPSSLPKQRLSDAVSR